MTFFSRLGKIFSFGVPCPCAFGVQTGSDDFDTFASRLTGSDFKQRTSETTFTHFGMLFEVQSASDPCAVSIS